MGITNEITRRLSRHEGGGWSLVDMWFFDRGADAAAVEHTVLEAWDDYGYGVAAADMPQAGYTETVSLDDVTEGEAVALIEQVVASLVDPTGLP